MDYAEAITAERVRRVINGYGEGDKAVAGTGGGFDFYTVGDPIFLADDNLNEAVGLDAIRDYVAYSEGIPTTDRTIQDNPYTPHLLGLNTDMAWLLIMKPIVPPSWIWIIWQVLNLAMRNQITPLFMLTVVCWSPAS